jgi:hypothetical protein
MTGTNPNHVPRDVLVLHPRDNVATALRDLDAGYRLQKSPGKNRAALVLHEAIAMCHKFALHDIAPGAPVMKYGEVIGHASQAITAGEHVHTHNLRSARAQVTKGAEN